MSTTAKVTPSKNLIDSLVKDVSNTWEGSARRFIRAVAQG